MNFIDKDEFTWVKIPIIDYLTGDLNETIACTNRCRDKSPCKIYCINFCDVEISEL